MEIRNIPTWWLFFSADCSDCARRSSNKLRSGRRDAPWVLSVFGRSAISVSGLFVSIGVLDGVLANRGTIALPDLAFNTGAGLLLSGKAGFSESAVLFAVFGVEGFIANIGTDGFAGVFANGEGAGSALCASEASSAIEAV